jgi:transposase
MKSLREAERRKRPEGWRKKIWILYHDNAPPHTLFLVHEFLAKHETVVPQPPYSPDLAPVDFFLFAKLKSTLKGCRFQTIKETEENWLWDLHTIPQNAFQDVLQNWKKRWRQCIDSEGEYFEADKSY